MQSSPAPHTCGPLPPCPSTPSLTNPYSSLQESIHLRGDDRCDRVRAWGRGGALRLPLIALLQPVHQCLYDHGHSTFDFAHQMVETLNHDGLHVLATQAGNGIVQRPQAFVHVDVKGKQVVHSFARREHVLKPQYLMSNASAKLAVQLLNHNALQG